MSEEHFGKVRDYLSQLDVEIVEENPHESLFVVRDESRGISSLLVDCEDQLLLVEQPIFRIAQDRAAIYKRLLKINRELVHGAFALDEDGQLVLFRDTLQLQNLDLNELDATINALALALATYADELIDFATPAQGDAP
jgi:hypothetical protein